MRFPSGFDNRGCRVDQVNAGVVPDEQFAPETRTSKDACLHPVHQRHSLFLG
jgi:hypothetical protein